jgi:hypothetical protein
VGERKKKFVQHLWFDSNLKLIILKPEGVGGQ